MTNSHLQMIYDFIGSHWEEHGYAPTPQEIATHFELSRKSAQKYLDLLRARNVIEWESHQQRTIRVIDKLIESTFKSDFFD